MAERLNSKYVIDDARRLGRGGMGEVFGGWTVGAEGFSHPVAIKRIRAEYGADEKFRSRFVREARLVARLSHTNIVTVFDFDRDEAGGLFLVMELVDGIDLAHLMSTGALPVPVALFVVAEVLRGLGHAHTLPTSKDAVQGLVHRDVSPSNILIGWDGAVKVSDFGFAKAREAMDASASIVVRGKAAYVSPEQATCRAVDGRSDLFSVGVMLWEMLCGESLFGSDNSPETLRRALRDPIVPPHRLREDIPIDVSLVALRLLTRDREGRYINAATALLALTACEAYPKTGRELLSALLRERMPEQAWRRIEHARPSTPLPDFTAEKIAGKRELPQPTTRLIMDAAIASRSEPIRVTAEPPPSAPRRHRVRRRALIGVVILSAMSTLFAAALFAAALLGNLGGDTGGDALPLPPAAGVAPRREPPVVQLPPPPPPPLPPGEPRASTRTDAPPPPPSSPPRGSASPTPARAAFHRPVAVPPASSTDDQRAASGILKLDLGPPLPLRATESTPPP